MTNMNPWQMVFFKCFDEALSKYFSGEVSSIEEVVILFDKLAEEAFYSNEYDEAATRYFNQFVNVKDLKLGDKPYERMDFTVGEDA